MIEPPTTNPAQPEGGPLVSEHPVAHNSTEQYKSTTLIFLLVGCLTHH